jgi:general stress protein 26
MATRTPTTELDEPYSAPDAEPVPWSRANRALDEAEVYWLSTVRPDGRPHVTPVAAVLLEGSLYFSTGPSEQKAHNLEQNSHCIVTTGCNKFHEGLDIVVEGDAVKTTDKSTLQRLTELFAKKYDDTFGFSVGKDGFVHEHGVAHVFEVKSVKAFSYERSASGAATRYRF